MAKAKRQRSAKNSIKSPHPDRHEMAQSGSPINVGSRRSNNALIAVVGIIAIVLIVYVALSVNSARNPSLTSENSDMAGQAFTPVEISRVCKLMVSGTTLFDSSAVSASLEKDGSIYYQGQTITAVEVTSNGCIIDVNGDEDFIAAGQVQQLGPVYLLIKEIFE